MADKGMMDSYSTESNTLRSASGAYSSTPSQWRPAVTPQLKHSQRVVGPTRSARDAIGNCTENDLLQQINLDMFKRCLDGDSTSTLLS